MKIVRFFFVACFIGTTGISSCGALSWATNSTEQATPIPPAASARSSKTPHVAEAAVFPVKPVTVSEAMQEAAQAVVTENPATTTVPPSPLQSEPAQKPASFTQKATQARTASDAKAPMTTEGTPQATPHKNGIVATPVATQNATHGSVLPAKNGTRTSTPGTPQKRLSGEWVQMEPGSRLAYVGIQGGTAPISLFKSSNGMVFAFTGQTGNDFVEVLRGSNVNASRSETIDKQKAAAKEAQQQAAVSSASPAQRNATQPITGHTPKGTEQVAVPVAPLVGNGTEKPAPASKVSAATTASPPQAPEQEATPASAPLNAAPKQQNASAGGVQNATVPSAATPISAEATQPAPSTNGTRMRAAPAPKVSSNATTPAVIVPSAQESPKAKTTEAAPAPAPIAQKPPPEKKVPQTAPAGAIPAKKPARASSATPSVPDAPANEGETVIFASGELASAMKGNKGEELLPFGLNNPDPEAALLLARGNLAEQEVLRPKFKPLTLQSYTATVFGTGNL